MYSTCSGNVEFGMNSPVEVFLVLYASIDNMFEKGCDIEWYSFSLPLCLTLIKNSPENSKVYVEKLY